MSRSFLHCRVIAGELVRIAEMFDSAVTEGAAMRSQTKQPTHSGSSTENGTSTYIAPKELMYRWQCSRTQVDRIARREGLSRMLLGSGKNGMVRYRRHEVEELESRKMA